MLSDHNTQIEVLKKKYDQVFSAGLGTMLHFKASLNVKPNQFSSDQDLFHLRKGVNLIRG